MPTILIVETAPLSALAGFPLFAGLPYRRLPESGPLAFSAEQLAAFGLKAPAHRAPEPIDDPPTRRLDEIERQLGRVIEQLEDVARRTQSNSQRLADHEFRLKVQEANGDHFYRHMGSHDAAIGSLRQAQASTVCVVEQLRKEVFQLNREAAAKKGSPPFAPPAPSSNGKPHNNGQCPGPGPLDVEKH